MVADPANASSGNRLSSVDRALRLVEHLAQFDGNTVPLVELAAQMQLNKSTLHHTLATLRHRGWVEQDESGGYRLGPATAKMAAWWENSDRSVHVLHPVLATIAQHTNELVNLGRISETQVVYLDKVASSRPLQVRSRVGQTELAATTALGRAIFAAANFPEATARRWIEAAPAAQRKSLAERFFRQIEAARQLGYAVEMAENEEGIGCVAVPLRIVNSCQTAISITVPLERLRGREAELARVIKQAVHNARLHAIETAL